MDYQQMNSQQKEGYVNYLRKNQNYTGELFEITIYYKSGNKHSFLVKNFTMAFGDATWEDIDLFNKPLKLGFDNIEAVYQTGYWEATND